jgi:isoquinoline 1-oxidoreductase subunit beta
MSALSRRAFVVASAAAGGGLLLALHARRGGASEAQGASPLNAFVRLDPDDTVTITVARPEMGQGVRTALPMLVAEELDVPWERVRVEQGRLDTPRYGEQYAGGSAVVRGSWAPLRKAGATARAMLVQAAALRWGVAASECRTEQGVVLHAASGRRARYGELAAEASRLTPPADVPLKPRAEWRLLGRDRRGVDVPDVVHGRAVFGLDVRVPGMLYAVIARAPVFGGRVSSVDDRAARAVPGVRAVVTIDADAVPDFGPNNPKMPWGVAVVADSTWAAMRGRDALRVTWDARGGAAESTDAVRAAALARVARPPAFVVRRDGDPDAALRAAARRVDATYEVPLLAHAPMEPLSCTASFTAGPPGRCELWAPTQNPEELRAAVRSLTGLTADAIVVNVVRMGGSFGRRFYSDFAAEAAYLSRAVRAPVQVVWTRADDLRHGFYRPAGLYRVSGGIDAAGRPVAWSQHLVNAPRGYTMKWRGMTEPDTWEPGEVDRDPFPAGCVPALRYAYSPVASRVPRGQWRAVEPSSNVFVTECFLDELAHAAGRDPLAYRLALLEPARELPFYSRTWSTGRLAAVLRLAAERAGWSRGTRRVVAGAARGLGIAGSYANGAYLAHVAEASVTDGAIRVHRVVSAVDVGLVVNPLGARAQVEGSVIYGLSAALRQEITVRGGGVVQRSFADYPTLRIDEAPEVEVHFVESDLPPAGMGEGALPPAAPAVANAVFAATGVRLRAMPFRFPR